MHMYVTKPTLRLVNIRIKKGEMNLRLPRPVKEIAFGFISTCEKKAILVGLV
jgi:hypothetical protein